MDALADINMRPGGASKKAGIDWEEGRREEGGGGEPNMGGERCLKEMRMSRQAATAVRSQQEAVSTEVWSHRQSCLNNAATRHSKPPLRLQDG